MTICKNVGYLFILLFFISCSENKKIAETSSASKSDRSFKTADLFFLTPEKQLEYYQSVDQRLPVNKIEAGTTKYPLIESPVDLSGFSFKYKDTLRTLEDFKKQTNAVGIIIIRNDSILFEQYNQNIRPATKWINFSVAKSVTSLLYGVALKDGYIHSLDEKVSHFIPELRGGVYDSVSLHNLLQMSSGVAWNDDSRDYNSDLFRIGRIEKEHGWKAALDTIKNLKRAAPPGQHFNYNTIETVLAGMILKNAIKKNLSEYLSEKIWKPFGMYADANWVMVPALDIENGGCCISATLRDYALLGLFAMKNGALQNGDQVLPKDWMQRSVTPNSSANWYGYYWWLRPESKRYFANGAFGQQIEIDPSQNTVVAIQSYWPTAFNDYYDGYIDTFIAAVLRQVKER